MIKTNKGNEFLVDEEFMEHLNLYSWHEDKRGYARTNVRCFCSNCQGKKRATRFLHQMVYFYHHNISCLNYSWYKDGIAIDHINNNKRDNRLENLQFLSRDMNNSKGGDRSKCSSQYNGVYWDKRDKKWISRYKVSGKHYVIGYFTDEIEAAKAYDSKCRELGLDRHLNFPI